MLAQTFDTPTLVTTGVIVVIVVFLGYRLLSRDPSVRRTRWGIFIERDHYVDEPEGETWTVDPLPPPSPPPPPPATQKRVTQESVTQESVTEEKPWPQRDATE